MDWSRPWSDLPEGIVELIINKLHYPDQIRALAVCKSWRVCKGYVRCSACLPWVISSTEPFYIDFFSESDSDDGFNAESNVQSSLCELFDPYSQKVKQVSKSIIMDSNGSYLPLAAKNGWVWALFVCSDSSKIFLHNPFTNEIRSVYPFPRMPKRLLHAAIKGDPTSLKYEIFTLYICADELHVDIVKHNSYTSDAIVQKLAEKYDSFDDALYINGYIYCLFRGDTLYRYGLEDGSWDLLTSGFLESYVPYYMCAYWLLEIKDNLIMVRNHMDEVETYTWMIFRFDWSKMSWVVETSLKSCAIYVSDFLVFSTPLKGSNGELLEGCRLFHCEDCELKCYSLSEAGGVEIQSEEYSLITRPSRFQLCFIERSYFGI